MGLSRAVSIAQLKPKRQKALKQLDSKKGKIGTGHRRKLTYVKVFSELKASGKPPEEIAEFLNK